MELLVILLGEFLFFPLIAALGALLNFIISVLSFIFAIIFELSVPGAQKVKKNKEIIPGSKKTAFPFKLITQIASAVFLILVLLLVTMNILFFQQTVTWVTSHVSKKTNTTISFKSVEGNIFKGTLKFGHFQVKRDHSAKMDFNIFVENLDLDIDLKSLISRPITLESLRVENVEGDIWQKNIRSKEPGKDGSKPGEQKIKTKTRFVVNDLILTDINLKLNKEEMVPLLLSLNKIEASPFRSNYAIFDTFFRSKIEGNLNGHKISITSEEIGEGRKTSWHLDHLPVSIIHYFVQSAPVSWFRNGDIDVRVEDKWEYGDSAKIEMDWNLQLNDIVVEVPEETSLINKSLALPIVNYINTKEDRIDLQFGLVMNEKQFESTASLDAAGLWTMLAENLSEKLSMMTGQKKEMIKHDIQNRVDDFKKFLKSKTKK